MLQNPRMLVNSIIQAPLPNYPERSFFLEKLLGQGSEGCVYLGKAQKWSNRVNDRVAIKFQIQMKQDEIDFIQTLIQIQNGYEQANNPKSLSQQQQASSNIIRIYEIFPLKDSNIILMEAGEQNLSLYLQSNKNKSFSNKLLTMKQITQAIQFLHLNGLIHRDIKPENFILVGDKFKLIDFGLIRQNNNNRLKTTQVGTPLFASPEIFEASNNYTQSVDIWSLACVFYELIEAQSLLSGNSIEDVKRKVINHKYQPDEIYNKIDILNTPNQFKSLLKEMLAPHPDKRCSIQNVFDQLTNILEKEEQQLQSRDNPRTNETKSIQQKQFIDASPNRQNKTDQNFFVQQNYMNNNQQIPIQKNQFPINNQQNNIENQVKSGIFQIQQLLGNQIKQAQDQNRELIEQIKSLTQQNQSLIDQTQKNQQSIEYLQQILFDKEKQDSKQISSTSTSPNRKQCNCDQENKQQLIILQKLIEKEKQSNIDTINLLHQFLQSMDKKIQQNFEENTKQHYDQIVNTKKSYQQVDQLTSKIDNFDKQMQSSISQLKQMIQSQQSQNIQIQTAHNDEFGVPQQNQNNYQKIVDEIYNQNKQLLKMLNQSLPKLIQDQSKTIKEDINNNSVTILKQVEQINGKLQLQQYPLTTQVPIAENRKNQQNQYPSQPQQQQQTQQNTRFLYYQSQSTKCSNKQEHYDQQG